MSSNDDIYFCELHLLEDFLHIFAMSHACKRSNSYTESSETLFEGLTVFLSEDEKRRYYGYLDS